MFAVLQLINFRANETEVTLDLYCRPSCYRTLAANNAPHRSSDLVPRDFQPVPESKSALKGTTRTEWVWGVEIKSTDSLQRRLKKRRFPTLFWPTENTDATRRTWTWTRVHVWTVKNVKLLKTVNKKLLERKSRYSIATSRMHNECAQGLEYCRTVCTLF